MENHLSLESSNLLILLGLTVGASTQANVFLTSESMLIFVLGALSFMIATPESGVDSIAVSWAMLDPIMTVVRPIAAFITAVSTGIAQNFFGTEDTPVAKPTAKKTGG